MPRKKRAREERLGENSDCLRPNSTRQGLTSDKTHNTTMGERLKSNDVFFNKLLDTIPESLLLPSYDEANGELIAARFMKNKGGASPHQKRKEDSKRNKKARYANDNVQATVLDRQKAVVTEEKDNESMEKQVLPPALTALKANATLANLDGLRDRIKKRIAELRNSRGGTAKEGGGRTKKGGKKVTEGMTVVSLKHGNSKVAAKTSKTGVPTTPSTMSTPPISSVDGNNSNEKTSGSRPLSRIEGSRNSISFGAIRIGGGSTGKKNKVSRPGSKMGQLRSLLDSTEKKVLRLEELKKTKEGREHIKEESMKDAIKAVSSTKRQSDHGTVGKVRKAIKRREKAKAKSTKQWKERESQVNNAKAAQQAKRKKNLQQRTKRGRAGFEGKKTDFIEVK